MSPGVAAISLTMPAVKGGLSPLSPLSQDCLVCRMRAPRAYSTPFSHPFHGHPARQSGRNDAAAAS